MLFIYRYLKPYTETNWLGELVKDEPGGWQLEGRLSPEKGKKLKDLPGLRHESIKIVSRPSSLGESMSPWLKAILTNNMTNNWRIY